LAAVSYDPDAASPGRRRDARTWGRTAEQEIGRPIAVLAKYRKLGWCRASIYILRFVAWRWRGI